MNTSITSQQYFERLDMLPEDLRDAYFSPDTESIIEKATEVNNLTPEQLSLVKENSGWVLLGFLHPDHLAEILIQDAGVNQATAVMIGRELNRDLFLPHKKSLTEVLVTYPPKKEWFANLEGRKQNIENNEATLPKNDSIIQRQAPALTPPTPTAPRPIAPLSHRLTQPTPVLRSAQPITPPPASTLPPPPSTSAPTALHTITPPPLASVSPSGLRPALLEVQPHETDQTTTGVHNPVPHEEAEVRTGMPSSVAPQKPLAQPSLATPRRVEPQPDARPHTTEPQTPWTPAPLHFDAPSATTPRSGSPVPPKTSPSVPLTPQAPHTIFKYGPPSPPPIVAIPKNQPNPSVPPLPTPRPTPASQPSSPRPSAPAPLAQSRPFTPPSKPATPPARPKPTMNGAPASPVSKNIPARDTEPLNNPSANPRIVQPAPKAPEQTQKPTMPSTPSPLSQNTMPPLATNTPPANPSPKNHAIPEKQGNKPEAQLMDLYLKKHVGDAQTDYRKPTAENKQTGSGQIANRRATTGSQTDDKLLTTESKSPKNDNVAQRQAPNGDGVKSEQVQKNNSINAARVPSANSKQASSTTLTDPQVIDLEEYSKTHRGNVLNLKQDEENSK